MLPSQPLCPPPPTEPSQSSSTEDAGDGSISSATSSSTSEASEEEWQYLSSSSDSEEESSIAPTSAVAPPPHVCDLFEDVANKFSSHCNPPTDQLAGTGTRRPVTAFPHLGSHRIGNSHSGGIDLYLLANQSVTVGAAVENRSDLHHPHKHKNSAGLQAYVPFTRDWLDTDSANHIPQIVSFPHNVQTLLSDPLYGRDHPNHHGHTNLYQQTNAVLEHFNDLAGSVRTDPLQFTHCNTVRVEFFVQHPLNEWIPSDLSPSQFLLETPTEELGSYLHHFSEEPIRHLNRCLGPSSTPQTLQALSPEERTFLCYQAEKTLTTFQIKKFTGCITSSLKKLNAFISNPDKPFFQVLPSSHLVPISQHRYRQSKLPCGLAPSLMPLNTSTLPSRSNRRCRSYPPHCEPMGSAATSSRSQALLYEKALGTLLDHIHTSAGHPASPHPDPEDSFPTESEIYVTAPGYFTQLPFDSLASKLKDLLTFQAFVKVIVHLAWDTYQEEWRSYVNEMIGSSGLVRTTEVYNRMAPGRGAESFPCTRDRAEQLAIKLQPDSDKFKIWNRQNSTSLVQATDVIRNCFYPLYCSVMPSPGLVSPGKGWGRSSSTRILQTSWDMLQPIFKILSPEALHRPCHLKADYFFSQIAEGCDECRNEDDSFPIVWKTEPSDQKRRRLKNLVILPNFRCVELAPLPQHNPVSTHPASGELQQLIAKLMPHSPEDPQFPVFPIHTEAASSFFNNSKPGSSGKLSFSYVILLRLLVYLSHSKKWAMDQNLPQDTVRCAYVCFQEEGLLYLDCLPRRIPFTFFFVDKKRLRKTFASTKRRFITLKSLCPVEDVVNELLRCDGATGHSQHTSEARTLYGAASYWVESLDAPVHHNHDENNYSFLFPTPVGELDKLKEFINAPRSTHATVFQKYLRWKKDEISNGTSCISSLFLAHLLVLFASESSHKALQSGPHHTPPEKEARLLVRNSIYHNFGIPLGAYQLTPNSTPITP